MRYVALEKVNYYCGNNCNTYNLQYNVDDENEQISTIKYSNTHTIHQFNEILMSTYSTPFKH